jgi:hypothetical protein
MAVFLRLDRGNTFHKSVKTQLVDGVSIAPLASTKYAFYVTATGSQWLLDKEGEEVKDGVVKAGQRVTLKLGRVATDKYHMQLLINPEIARSGYVGGPSLIEPHDKEELEFLFKAEKQIDFSKLEYLFRLYIID